MSAFNLEVPTYCNLRDTLKAKEDSDFLTQWENLAIRSAGKSMVET